MKKNLKKEIFNEGYLDGYSQCLVNIEGMLKNTSLNEEVIEHIINNLNKARKEYLEANEFTGVVENY